MQNDWAGRARLSHALLSLTAGKPVKVRRAGRCACIFQAVAQTPTEAQAPEYLGGCLRAGAPYMGSSRSSGRLCDSLIYALSTAPPDVRSCRCEGVSICGACRGRGAGRTLIFKQLMVQRRAAVLSECLINGPMSPWSRGGARVVPRRGCAEMGGRGPCVP